jgi:hypothetical protein
MAIVASRLATPPLHASALPTSVRYKSDFSASSSVAGPTRLQRLRSGAADAGILVAAVWSLPLIIVAVGTPVALAILAVLQLIRLLQHAF